MNKAVVENPKVLFKTEMGNFVVELFEDKAPATTNNLLKRVDMNMFEGSTIYRIVTHENQHDDLPVKIQVVQFGYPTLVALEEGILPPVAHETTAMTGLRHLDGTLSMGRKAPGTASSAFFICVGDQPELDFGGRRNPDGQGFAAFGHVVEGMDVVRAIFAKGQPDTDYLRETIPLAAVERL